MKMVRLRVWVPEAYLDGIDLLIETDSKYNDRNHVICEAVKAKIEEDKSLMRRHMKYVPLSERPHQKPCYASCD
jgi:metal-responsive CopG/Arc/MetJ family transcriptional regulator